MAFGNCLIRAQKRTITFLDCIYSTQIFNDGEVKIDFGIKDSLKVFISVF